MLRALVKPYFPPSSSKSNVKESGRPERRKKTARRAGNLTTSSPPYDPVKSLTKTFPNWSVIANASPTSWQIAAARGPSRNSTSDVLFKKRKKERAFLEKQKQKNISNLLEKAPDFFIICLCKSNSGVVPLFDFECVHGSVCEYVLYIQVWLYG